MERITTTQLEHQLKRTAAALGVSVNHWERTEDGRNVAVVGALVLSKEYRGWQLHRITNEHGGVTVLFGHCTLPAWEMYCALEGMREAAEIVRENVLNPAFA